LDAPPDSTDARLQALRRFFLYRYQEEVQKSYPAFRDVFPFWGGSRLDLVRINGGVRVHFLYREGDAAEHLVVVHDLTVSGAAEADEREAGFVQLAVKAQAPLAHFVLRPPFEDRFDEVEQHAVAAVAQHARRRPGMRAYGQN
jgi:hypothetical protein